ncbi:hypothetical protein [Sphingomonas sp. NIBR02145]|uniref:hypothetical protein n=1 Tax=Sphingomonas sp. NIBR02145 TaxID=3014784 RepID=UPI0022B4EC70|nr:hypothetical protein [Sphingomonas sp. NIBR02145]WHU03552.1 hypothetical protein O3305_02795 [Sphingomonas sp. NIBR02145]
MESNQQSSTVRFVQGSAAPVFRGEPESGLTFLCEQCGHVLIDHYLAEDYIAVGIQCFQCKHVSFTPDIELGEIFSARTMTFPDQGGYLIGGTVTKRAGLMIASSAAFNANIEMTTPAEAGIPFELNFKGLDRLVEIYAETTGGDFAAQRKIVERSPAKFRHDLTFAWAIGILRDRLAANVLDVRDADTCSALIYISTFGSIYGRWKRHPRFNLIARGFAKPKSFLHTAGLFTTAFIMYQNASIVGLALEDRYGEPNPDLYVRGVQGSRTYLEVKAPQALQTIGEADPPGMVESAVKQIVDRSKAQINRNRVGGLVLFATGFRKNLANDMARFSHNALVRVGRQRTSLAAIMSISLADTKLTIPAGRNGMIEMDFRLGGVANPHFAGDNPFKFEA